MPIHEAQRRGLLESMTTVCTLEHVAKATAEHARPERVVYVERRAGGYRWCPTHAGGPYPLQREVALVLDLPHTAFVLSFETVDGKAIMCADASVEGDLVASSFIEPTTDALENAQLMRAALGSNPPP